MSTYQLRLPEPNHGVDAAWQPYRRGNEALVTAVGIMPADPRPDMARYVAGRQLPSIPWWGSEGHRLYYWRTQAPAWLASVDNVLRWQHLGLVDLTGPAESYIPSATLSEATSRQRMRARRVRLRRAVDPLSEPLANRFMVYRAMRRTIQPYDWKPAYRFYGEPGPYYGVELEIDASDSHFREARAVEAVTTRHEWYCKHDGSLNAGFECVSHPLSWSYWCGNNLLDWCDTVRKAGYTSWDTATCGMHVHVSRTAVNDQTLSVLLYFFSLNRGKILRVSRRRNLAAMNRWARVPHGRDTADHVAKTMPRYFAINTLPRDTVEFRMFHGTLDPAAIRRNLAFVVAAVDFAKTRPVNVRRRGLTWWAFCKYLQSHAARELLTPTWADALHTWCRGMLPAKVGQRLVTAA